MIVLLSYSTNLLGNKVNTFYKEDSIAISIDDIRTVTSKMIELKYIKQINAKKDTIINNKDIQINFYKKNCETYKKQRNKSLMVSGASILSLILVLLFK